MLTTEAFNALLKTLEEPPPHIKFIFATTDPQDLPATILSRCQRFDFSAIPAPVMKSLLAEIIRKEGREAEPEAIDLVCRQSAGSMRDAQSLLDQALAYADGVLTAQAVHELLGSANEDLVALLAKAIAQGDPAAVLEVLDSSDALAVSYKQLLLQLASWWRDCMLLQAAGKTVSSLNVSPKFVENVRELAGRMGMEAVLAGLDLIDSALMRLKDSPHPRLLVELTLVRMARLGELIPVGQLAVALLEGRGAGPSPAAAMAPQRLPAPVVQRDTGPDPKKALAGGRGEAPVTPVPPVSVTLASQSKEPDSPIRELPNAVSPAIGPRELADAWEEILQSAGMTLSAGLVSAKSPRVTGPGVAVLRFPARATRDHDFVQSRLPRLNEIARELTGQSWTFKLELEGGSRQGLRERSPEAAPPTLTEQQQATAASLLQIRSDIEKIPLVNRAIEIFHAEIVNFDRDFGKRPEPAEISESVD